VIIVCYLAVFQEKTIFLFCFLQMSKLTQQHLINLIEADISDFECDIFEDSDKDNTGEINKQLNVLLKVSSARS